MKKIIIILFLFPTLLYGQKDKLVIDSLRLSFQDKLFSASPIVRKHQSHFYFYDLVSEKIVVAEESGKLVKDSTLSAGKVKISSENREVKLFYKNMYVKERCIYFSNGSAFRYSHDFKKLPIHKLSFKNTNPSLKNTAVGDAGFLVGEEENMNYYIVRVFTASAENLVYAESYTKGFYQRPLYAVFEKALNDTILTPATRMIIPYDKIYQEKLPLGYAYTQTITWGKKGTLLTTEGATEKIRIYDLEGREIEVFGEKGKYMSKKDTVASIAYPQEANLTVMKEIEKLFFHYQEVNPVYGQVYYDAKADKVYREYSPKIEAGEKRKRFIQVYHKKKLQIDVPFLPQHRIIAIENDIIWTYKVNPDGETPPQYLYKIKLK